MLSFSMKNFFKFPKKSKCDNRTRAGYIMISSGFALLFLWMMYLVFNLFEMGGSILSYFLMYVIIVTILLVACMIYGYCMFCGFNIFKGKKWKK